MRLLRLELSGFKSFCDKVSISFIQNGVSVIVGPNGCGKSNIVDAIRWALGEQSAKHLRGMMMGDVIFNGSKSRQPVNMAQVTLTFANPKHDTLHKYAEFSEISTTRKLFRSGESQYLINNTSCRLSDIRELFMDTGIGGKGYSIIEQGKIERIVLSKPEDKRAIIDEAAGIIRFKTKKAEAQKKLETTKLNLSRVKDIIHELESQEENLRSQAEEAEIYTNTKARIERLEQCVQSKNWLLIKERIKKNQDEMSSSGHDLQTAQNVILKIEMDEESKKLMVTRLSVKIDENKGELLRMKEDFIKLESKKESDEAALKHLSQWHEKSLDEIRKTRESLSNKKDDFEKMIIDLEGIDKETTSLIDSMKKMEEEKKDFETKEIDFKDNLNLKEKRQVALLSAISAEKQKLRHFEEKEGTYQENIKQIKSNRERLLSKKGAHQNQIARDTEELEKIKLSQADCEDQLRKLNLEVISLKSALDDIILKSQASIKLRQQHESRLQSLNEIEKSHEEFDSATKIFLDYLDQNTQTKSELGYLGTLPELFALPEEPPQQIITFLNQHFNLLVFSSSKRLREIVLLHHQIESEQIHVCFLDLMKKDGLSNQLELNDFYQSLESPIYDLSRESLREAEGFVDAASCIMTREKIFLIGFPGEKNKVAVLMQRRSEQQKLKESLEVIEREYEGIEKEKNLLERQLEEKTTGQEEKKERLSGLALERVGFEKDIYAKNGELERIEGALKRNDFEMQKIINEKEKSAYEKEAIEGSLKKKIVQQHELEVELEGARSENQGQVAHKEKLTEMIHQVKVRLTSLEEQQKNVKDSTNRLNQEKNLAQDSIDRLSEELGETQKKKTLLHGEIEEKAKMIPIKLDEITLCENKIRELSDEFEEHQAGLQKMQKEIKEENLKFSRIKESFSKLEVRKAQLDQEALNIESNLFAQYSVTPEEISRTFNYEQFQISKETKKVEELKKEIGKFEGVNLAAKREWESLCKRLTFLRTQSEDLNKSMETLENSISKIDQESIKRFKDAFDDISEKFTKTFQKLFGGGEAKLKLVDENDLLNTGVDIIAQPPGKKLQNMFLLSGGEKALTAISLIFAIFMTKPSPFCLLDEVDAPLDDANNLRFNQHVLELTENSQFIIITHNKKTMEISDALFGVTMEEPGVSKIVSVNFQDHKKEGLKEAG
ncbi:MAG: chromosome segregation protein SMC [Deltaproteobacteria bacterium]|nr:chromosome segregation protein SMC [Deltaproteobacteria bacterium]